MKLKVLVDNNTFIGESYYGEPGLSFFIEDGENKILFDLGFTDVCVKNAYKMGIDINDTNMIVLSHGHLDHTWGLTYFMQNLKPSTYQDVDRKISIIAHPLAVSPKIEDGEPIGFIYSERLLDKCFDVKLTKDPLWISEKLCFLGEIERSNQFENKNPLGTTVINGMEQDDFLLDDSALVYKAEKGLVIITGCSHSGICNIIEYAKKVCRENVILDIIGGFHLLKPNAQQMDSTLNYMKELNPHCVHACHCTDLHSKIELAKVVRVKEVGVGLTLEFE